MPEISQERLDYLENVERKARRVAVGLIWTDRNDVVWDCYCIGEISDLAQTIYPEFFEKN